MIGSGEVPEEVNTNMILRCEVDRTPFNNWVETVKAVDRARENQLNRTG